MEFYFKYVFSKVIFFSVFFWVRFVGYGKTFANENENFKEVIINNI